MNPLVRVFFAVNKETSTVARFAFTILTTIRDQHVHVSLAFSTTHIFSLNTNHRAGILTSEIDAVFAGKDTYVMLPTDAAFAALGAAPEAPNVLGAILAMHFGVAEDSVSYGEEEGGKERVWVGCQGLRIGSSSCFSSL
jgi:hypothetical protein